MKFITTMIFTFITSTGYAAAQNQNISCRGNLQVFAVKGKSAKALNKDMTGFNTDIQSASYFFIGKDIHQKFIEIYPWGSITEKLFPENFQQSFRLDFTSDRKSTFAVKLVGKTSKYSESLSCSLN